MTSAESIAKELANNTPLLIEKVLINTPVKNRQQAFNGLVETIRFLLLCSQNTHRLAPSIHVDIIWHELILFTRCYQQLCDVYFSRFIHHTPSDKSKTNQDVSNYELTLILYSRTFGEPCEQYWPNAKQLLSNCGACESK